MTTKRHNMFTLIELLVVIGIIAILMSILLPTLSFARQAAKSTQCLSNLKQLGILATIYTNNYSGMFPPATDGTRSWDFGPDGSPGILYDGMKDGAGIKQCPSFQGVNPSGDQYSGYNYNTTYIGHGVGESIETPTMITQVADPSRTVLFGDGECSIGANKFMRAPFADKSGAAQNIPLHSFGTQGYRHNGRTNVCFVDGHVESISLKNSSNYLPGGLLPANVGFISNDDELYDLE